MNIESFKYDTELQQLIISAGRHPLKRDTHSRIIRQCNTVAVRLQ